MKEAHFDIMIVGSGIVGATTALALAKQTPLKIALIDSQDHFPAWTRDAYEPRVSAISQASKHIFQALDVWEKITAKRVSPYTNMYVWDAESKAEIHFDCRDVAESALGYIVEDQVIRESLHQVLREYGSIHFIHPVTCLSLEKHPGKINLHTEQQLFSAKCLIAADGANSWVREQLNISMKDHAYGHTAIVTTVKTELPHQQTAWQRFLPTGPLAFLPLDDPRYCSIVWSTSPEHAEQLMSQNKTEFCQTLAEAFAFKLGKISHTETRYHFPLRMRHVKEYVQDHIALIGDAAHTIHPLAGQGVNLGLLDAASLAEVIAEAHKKNRDYFSYHTLRRYERWRKSDNAVMLSGVAFLKELFASDKQAVKTLRTYSLNAVDKVSMIKNIFASYALGDRVELPLIVQKQMKVG